MQKLKRSYYYLFYKFYKMSEAAPSRWMSDWKAGLVIIALELWFLYSILNYYNIFIDKYFDPSKMTYIVISMVVAAINYYCFIHSDIWKKYVVEFDQLPKRTNKIGSWIVIGIVLFVIANLIFSFFLMSQIDWSQYR